MYSYINRSSQKSNQYIRDLLQYWFNQFPDINNKKKDLWNSFRAHGKNNLPEADISHLSAFFEIYLYIFFKRLGFHVEVEPQDNEGWQKLNSYPDFRLTTKSGVQLLVEATGAYSTDELKLKRKFEGEILNYLNQHLRNEKFVIRLFSKSRPKKPLFPRKIYQYIQGELDRITHINKKYLLPETYSQNDNWHINTIYMADKFGWDAEFFVEPRIYNSQDIAGRSIIAASDREKTATEGIRDRIKEKQNQFGIIQIPYILAINVCYNFFHKSDIFEALFGELCAYYPRNDSQPQWFRQNGSFFDRRKKRATHVSGILFSDYLTCENMTFNTPTLWHHPFADRLLTPTNWQLKQQIHNQETSRMEDFDNSPHNPIFEIEDNDLREIFHQELLNT